jgi:hypothetical protein
VRPTPQGRSRSRSRRLRHRVARWRRRVRRWRYRHSKALKRATWTVVGILGLGLAWILVTGYLAHRQAEDLALRIGQVELAVSQGRVADARQLGADIPHMAERIHDLTTGPAWWVAADIPYLGDPLESARVTTSVVADVGEHAVPLLLTVTHEIDPANLRTNGHTIRLEPLVKAAPALVAADRLLSRAVQRLDGGATWLSFVDSGRAGVRARLDSLRGYVDAAARVAKIFPIMLGRGGTQRYFLGLQNEAELRGTGGLPGAFAIASVTNGSIKFERFESDSALLPAKSRLLIDTGLDFGRQYDALYAKSGPTRFYVNSNVSPDFPTAARIWAAMWERVSGEHVNGVIAVDPTAISYFLAAVGPAPLPAYHSSIDANNVVPFTERDEYTAFPDPAKRKAYLVAVLKAAATKLVSGAGAPIQLVQAATHSATEQRLLVWHENPRVEKALDETHYSGAIPSARSRRPFSAVILNNAAAGKLDYYLERSINYARTGCGSRRDVLVTVTLNNTAPASGLPHYVTDRLDADRPRNVKPGDNRTLLDYFATPGARLQSVTVDGQPSVASIYTYLGHQVFRVDIELPRGKTRTIVLHLDEPARPGTPNIWKQPGVTPLTLDVFNQKCG